MYVFNQKLITKAIIWLAAEILFNFVGIDDLADYSEFVFERKIDISIAMLMTN